MRILSIDNEIVNTFKKGSALTKNDLYNLNQLPRNHLICYLNDFKDALDKFQDAKPFLKVQNNGVYLMFKEAIPILRKVKYN